MLRKSLVAASLTLLLSMGKAAPVEMNAWNIHPAGYPVTQAMEFFSDTVAKNTGGRYSIKVHSAGVLGDQPKAVQMLKAGEIDLAEFNLSPLAEAAPSAKVLTIPFLFRGPDHMFRQLDGKLGERFAEKLKGAGYIVLGWYDGGARSFYCNAKRIQQVSDFNGLKVRVQQSEMAMEMVRLLGATPVVLPYREVLDGLKTSKVDCAENNLPSYDSAGHMTAAKQVFMSNHQVSPEALVMSVKAWSRLTEADQKVFLEAGKQSALKMRQLWRDRVELSRQNAVKQGSEFTIVYDYGPLIRRMGPLHGKYLKDPTTRDELLAIIASSD